MRPINLLPPEVARQRTRRRRVALMVVAAIAYVAVLALGVLIWNGRIDTARRNLDTQLSVNQTLERQVVALSESGNLRDEFNAKADLVRSALETDIDWGIILNDLARLLPPRLWVETFSGTIVPATTPGVVGQVAFSGIGFDFPDVSAWLRALDSEQFSGITGTWVSTISEGVVGNDTIVTFTSTAALTEAATTNRADELIPEVPLMRRPSVLIGLAIFIVTGAWWMFLISPRNGEISDLERERNVAVDTESRLRVQIQQLEEIRDSEVQYLAALGTLESLIPERPLLEEFIEQIYALANETGVELQTLAPSVPAPSADGSELREIAVSVTVEGQFFEVLGFMFGLSDMERLVRIDSVAASSSEDEFEGTIIAASLELRLFTLADLLPILDEVSSPPTTTTDDTTPDGGFEASDNPSASGGDG